jgi:hypothetical protein
MPGGVWPLYGDGGGHDAGIRSAVFPGLVTLLHEVVEVLVVRLATSRMYLAIVRKNRTWIM